MIDESLNTSIRLASTPVDLGNESINITEQTERSTSKSVWASLGISLRNLLQEGTLLSLRLALSTLKSLNKYFRSKDFTSSLSEDSEQKEQAGCLDGCLTKLIKVSLLAIAFSPWYWATGRSREKPSPHYDIPKVLNVKDTDLPSIPLAEGNKKQVEIDKLDLSGAFYLETDRYKIIKEEDFFISRMIGHPMSCFGKIFFLDTGVGSGFDSQSTKELIAMLESSEHISGLTVRVNNNGVFHDCARLFIDEDVVDRNPFAARVLIGLPTTFLGECFSELRRGDYYNPMTQTVVLYSDIHSVSAHEMGHHQDFQRFDSDWAYSMCRSFPPAMLYQEWQASVNAKNDIMAKEDAWQFYRFLLPAFATYLLASYYLSKAALFRETREEDRKYVDPIHVFRHMSTWNAQLYSGILTYAALAAAGSPFILSAGGFAGAFLGSRYLADAVASKFYAYPHEEASRF